METTTTNPHTEPSRLPRNPPAGYTTITPFLVVDGAARAIDFYCSVFGARLVTRTDNADGTVAHAELELASGRFQVADPAPSMKLIAPSGGDTVDHSYAMYVDDVDAVWQRAVDAGATPFHEPDTFVTGDRFGAVLDPFGHRWALLTRVEDVSEEEAARRVDAWLAEQAD